MTIRELYIYLTEHVQITLISERSNKTIFRGQADCLPIKYLSLEVVTILPINNRLEVIVL